MAAEPAPNSARLIAPVALAVFVIVFFAVILSNGSSDEKKGKQASAATGKRSSSTKKTKSRTPTRSTYTVKIGDNLPAIARKTGVSVEKIQEVNPQLDPYGLQAGQKIKLRE